MQISPTARAGQAGSPGQAQAALSPASLQAQLDLYRHRLSDCVNCASATTPSGKSAIATLSAAISQIEARLVSAASGAPAPPATAPVAPASGALIDVYA